MAKQQQARGQVLQSIAAFGSITALLSLAACGAGGGGGNDSAGGPRPGTVLDKQACEFKMGSYTVPGVSCHLVRYTTTDTRGLPSQTYATVLVPDSAPPAGQRVLLSYQTAEDGLTTKCAPSNTLRNGTENEAPNIAGAVNRGWVVVVPDFEGPDSQFEARINTAHGVLDGIRAAESMTETGLQGSATPVALWGFSGGGFATLAGAEGQPAYAPELNIIGLAEGGSAFDIRSTFAYLDGGPFAGVVFAGLVGVLRAYSHEFKVDDYFNDAGKALIEELGEMCVGKEAAGVEDPAYRYPFQSLDQYTLQPSALDLPLPLRIQADNSLGKTAPPAPVFLYHGSADELISYEGQAQLQYTRYCEMGVPVDFFTLPAGEHIETAVLGVPFAMQFLADRFAGKPLAPLLPGNLSCNMP